MAHPEQIQPDLEFIRELQAAGGTSVKKCYQCATCSVACPISPNDNPFPRKEMIWAQWGLKDKLASDPDIWLCYNCGGCSDLCPRGANPADLMSAMRAMVYKKLLGPSFMGEWMSSPKYLPMLIAIPAIIFGFFWWLMASINFGGYYSSGGMFPDRNPISGIEFGRVFYGDYIIDPIFTGTAIAIVILFYLGIRRLIAKLAPQGTVLMLGKRKSVFRCLLDAIFLEILPHSRFAECGDAPEKQGRKIGHMTLFLGFISLLTVTALIAAGHWFGRIPGLEFIYLETPLPMAHPIKLLALLGTVLLLVGLTMLTLRRKSLDPSKFASSYYDWYLLGVIWAVFLTGLGSLVLRLADMLVPAYCVYYLHLISIFMLIAYLPWSKLGHLVYRTAAITYVRYMGRR